MEQSERPFRVLFLCTGNSARSVFAEYFLKRLGGKRFEAYSAGADPSGVVNPLTLKVLRERFNIDGWHPPFDPDGSYDLTGYAIHAADIRQVNPYAAYNLSDDKWTVRPPDLPQWSAQDFPQGPALMQQARALIAEVRAILRLPEPFRRQEAERIWRYIHEGRAQSFTPGGLGWQGTGNVLEKALDQASGALVGKLKAVIYGPDDGHPHALAQGLTTADVEPAHA